MKKLLIVILLCASFLNDYAQAKTADAPVRTILATGGNFSIPYIKYVIKLTKKKNPKICFMGTAGGDNILKIIAWYDSCRSLPMRPYVQKVFLNSSPDQETFEQKLLSMDAIIMGGGNTVDMIAIWKAQGIDSVLLKAYKKGIVLAGGSAGSLCWFQGGTTDSRPINLSLCSGLGFLPYSHSPHWRREQLRRPLYRDAILTGKLNAGYAVEDFAAVLFENEKYVKSVSLDTLNHTYFLSVVNGKINEKLLPVTEIVK
ncbi:MAG: Peptidase [Mucilaginibacter sp.]|jgi:dipeptidase E|nr:Peptidase [Mucilaginibacter sp.]